MVAKRSNELLVEIEEDVTNIYSDATKFKQILLNLLSNSCKFTDRGEIKLTVKCDGDYILVSVIDNGIGMSKEQKEKVFDAFVQADSSVTRKYGGTGLGLSISKRYVEMMGGSMQLKSDENKGSIFSFTILKVMKRSNQ